MTTSNETQGMVVASDVVVAAGAVTGAAAGAAGSATTAANAAVVPATQPSKAAPVKKTVKTRKDSGVWGDPPAPPKKQRNANLRSALSYLLTALLTLAIVFGDLLVPSLFAPLMDPYKNVVVVLDNNEGASVAPHVFDEPVSLYPWDLYDEQNSRLLSSAERDFLSARGIPDFLLKALQNRNLDLSTQAEPYHNLISNSFRFLQTDSSTAQGCYVLVDQDVDSDGTTDLRCAVDLEGNIISLLFLSKEWEKTEPLPEPEAAQDPKPTMDPAPSAQPDEATEGATSAEGIATDASADDAATGATGGGAAAATEEGAAAADTPSDAGAAVAGTGADATQPSAPNTPTASANTLPAVEYLPIEEDYQIWAFVYATVKEAELLNQQKLAHALSLLDTSFTYRYGYPFSSLIPEKDPDVPVDEAAQEADGATAETDGSLVESADPAVPVIPPNLPLTPFVLTSEEFQLFIYDLPDSTRLIIYLDPTAMRCTGFSLQLP